MSPTESASDLKLSPGTIAVHGGERTDEREFGAVVSPEQKLQNVSGQ